MKARDQRLETVDRRRKTAARIFVWAAVWVALAGAAQGQAVYTLDLAWKELAFTNQMALGEVATVELRNIGPAAATNLTMYLSNRNGDMLAITEGMEATGTYARAELELNTTNLLAEYDGVSAQASLAFDLTVWDAGRSVMLASAPVWIKNNALWETLAWTNLPAIETLGLAEYLARAYDWSNGLATVRYTLDLGWKDLRISGSMALAERAVIEVTGIGTATPEGLMLYLSNREMEPLAISGYMVASSNEAAAVGMLNLATTNLLAEFDGATARSEKTFELTVWDSERDVMLGSGPVPIRNNPLAYQFVDGWTNVADAAETEFGESVAAAVSNAAAALALATAEAGRIDALESGLAAATGATAAVAADVATLQTGKVGAAEWSADYATLLNTNLYTYEYLLQVEAAFADHASADNPHGITAQMIGALTNETDAVALAAIAALPEIPTNAATESDLEAYLPLAATGKTATDGTASVSWATREIAGWELVSAGTIQATNGIWVGGIFYSNLTFGATGDVTQAELDEALEPLVDTNELENALLTIPDRFLGDLATTGDLATATAGLATEAYADAAAGTVQSNVDAVALGLTTLSNATIPRTEIEETYVPRILFNDGIGLEWSFDTNQLTIGWGTQYQKTSVPGYAIETNQMVGWGDSFLFWGTDFGQDRFLKKRAYLELYRDVYVRKSGVGAFPGIVHFDPGGLEIGGSAPLVQSTETAYFTNALSDWSTADYSAMSRTGTLVLTNDLGVFHAQFTGEWDGAELRFSQDGDNVVFWMNEGVLSNGVSYLAVDSTNTESVGGGRFVFAGGDEEETVDEAAGTVYAQMLETEPGNASASYFAPLAAPGSTSTAVCCLSRIEARYFNDVSNVGTIFETRGMDLHVDDSATDDSAANLRTVGIAADEAKAAALAEVYARAGTTKLMEYALEFGPRFRMLEEGEDLNVYFGDNPEPIWTLVGGGSIVPRITGIELDDDAGTVELTAYARTSGVYAVDWTTNWVSGWTRIPTGETTQATLDWKTILLTVTNPVVGETNVSWRIASLVAPGTEPKVRSLAKATSGTNDDELATQPWVISVISTSAVPVSAGVGSLNGETGTVNITVGEGFGITTNAGEIHLFPVGLATSNDLNAGSFVPYSVPVAYGTETNVLSPTNGLVQSIYATGAITIAYAESSTNASQAICLELYNASSVTWITTNLSMGSVTMTTNATQTIMACSPMWSTNWTLRK